MLWHVYARPHGSCDIGRRRDRRHDRRWRRHPARHDRRACQAEPRRPWSRGGQDDPRDRQGRHHRHGRHARRDSHDLRDRLGPRILAPHHHTRPLRARHPHRPPKERRDHRNRCRLPDRRRRAGARIRGGIPAHGPGRRAAESIGGRARGHLHPADRVDAPDRGDHRAARCLHRSPRVVHGPFVRGSPLTRLHPRSQLVGTPLVRGAGAEHGSVRDRPRAVPSAHPRRHRRARGALALRAASAVD